MSIAQTNIISVRSCVPYIELEDSNRGRWVLSLSEEALSYEDESDSDREVAGLDESTFDEELQLTFTCILLNIMRTNINMHVTLEKVN